MLTIPQALDESRRPQMKVGFLAYHYWRSLYIEVTVHVLEVTVHVLKVTTYIEGHCTCIGGHCTCIAGHYMY